MHPSLAWVVLLAAPFLAAPLLQSPENSGIEMTIRHTFSGHWSEQKYYFLADRKRVESRNAAGRRKRDGSTEWLSGPRLAMITRCDLGQIFELNLDAGEYQSAAYPPKPWTKEEIEARQLTLPDFSPSVPRTIRIETTTVDTGERKEFFGHVARHVITTTKQIPLVGSQAEPQETLADGWYIDLQGHLSCDRIAPAGRRGHIYATFSGRAAETPEFVDIGEAETGFAVQLVMTTKGAHKLPDGTRKEFASKNETLVTELREGPVDPALFEVPAGFTHVEHIERDPRVASSSSRFGEFWERLKNLLD
jgi:hypothetical protein